MRRAFLATALFLLYAGSAAAQVCTDGATAYDPGRSLIKKRSVGSTEAAVATFTGQGWKVDHIDAPLQENVAYNVLVFRCPIPPPPPPPVIEQPPVVVQPGDYGYFDTLVALPSHWLSNSLRSQALIDAVSLVKPNRWVTYDPAKDAAKSVIPAFVPLPALSNNTLPALVLGAPLSATADRIVFAAPLSTLQKNNLIANRGLLVDEEVLTVNVPTGTAFGAQFIDDSTLLVKRAQGGSIASAHNSGASIDISVNSLLDYLRIPLGTQDGHSYLFTWDIWYDSSYLGTDLHVGALGHKEFQFAAPKTTNPWFELRIGRSGNDGLGRTTVDTTKTVGLFDVRYYDYTIVSSPGVNVTGYDSLKPQAARFAIGANRWTRFWVHVDQRADDYDRVSVWLADSETAPVKVIDALTLRVLGTPASILSWWLEQNTSQDVYRGARRDLVSYVKNFAALRDVADVTPLLVAPIAQPVQ